MADPAPEEDAPLLPRSRLGCFVLAVPAVFGFTLAGAWVSMYALGLHGRPADGEVWKITYTACPEAKAPLLERVGIVGLGDPVIADTPGGFALQAQMPADTDVADAITVALARRGEFSLVDPSGLTVVPPGHVGGASLELADVGGGTTLIQLDTEGARLLEEHQKAHPQDYVSYVLDGETLGKLGNSPVETRGNLEIVAVDTDGLRSLTTAADRALAAGTPLPCAVERVGHEVVP